MPDIEARVRELLAEGVKLSAIHEYRMAMQVTLLEAKHAVDNIEAGLTVDTPHADRTRYWAARVPSVEVQALSSQPDQARVRWLVLAGLPGEDSWLLYLPDERSGRTWDDWFLTRDDAVEAAAGYGVTEADWVEVSQLGDWPIASGWPAPGWLPESGSL